MNVFKIMHRPRTYGFLPKQFVPKTPVQSVPLWDATGCAGGARGVVCVFVQLTCCAGGLCDVCGQMLRVTVVRHSLEVCSLL